MKITKHILLALLLVSLGMLLLDKVGPDDTYMVVIACSLLGFFVMNVIIRRSLIYKRYFTSRSNPFTNKYRYQQSFDISKELMFEKMEEILRDSKLKLVDSDKEKLELLALSPISFASWGENLYVSFEENNQGTLMELCSTTFFQMYDWGRNKRNCDHLVTEIEDSFTV